MCDMNSPASEQGPEAGSYDVFNKTSTSLEVREFIYLILDVTLDAKERLFCLKFVATALNLCHLYSKIS
jgi:hypothetical protein